MTAVEVSLLDAAQRFGPFVLYPFRKLLLENGKPVRLGSRAMDLLVVLVQRAGDVVSREELEAYVWPRTVVEATSLRVHISALRKALGDGGAGERYIMNVPGRGYSFVMRVAQATEPAPPAPPVPQATPRPTHNLPVRLSKVLGRSTAVAELNRQLEARRLVSIVGAGGMGKTTTALAVAEERLALYPDGVWFVDLAPLPDAALVPNALAGVLGISLSGTDPLLALQTYLANCQMLIVLDNCEHVIASAALLAERVVGSAAQVHMLTTSREPLYADGEWIYRLPALEMPDARTLADQGSLAQLDQAMKWPALQLFIERATADNDRFMLSGASFPMVAHLCRQLDGMPLAIELAAGRIDSLGLQGLVSRLDDMFRLLRRGRRTALPRHQTLQALLDWSHDLLNDFERVVLRRLTAFSSSFTLESAIAVVSFGHVGPSDAIESLSSLASKSLVVTDTSGDFIHYRLLSTTRRYAREKLEDSGEAHTLVRRHAEHFQALLDRSRTQKSVMLRADWMALYGFTVDDVRSALDWAFSEDGDDLLGATLASSSLELAYELVNFDPRTARLEPAMAALKRLPAPSPVLELRLLTASCFFAGHLITNAGGHEAAFGRMMALAEQLQSHRHTVEALYSMCTASFGGGDYLKTREVAERIGALSERPFDPAAKLLSDRFMVLGCHYLGEHRQARAIIERALVDPAEMVTHYYHQVSPQVSLRIMLARILWIQGQVDQAVAVADQALALSTDEVATALPYTLAFASIPIALWRGDPVAQDLLDRLRQSADRYSLAYWQAWHRMLHMSWAMRHLPMDGQDLLATLRHTANPASLDMLATLSDTLLTPDTLQRVEDGLVGWCGPEVLRAQAEGLLRQAAPAATAEAEALLARALRMAEAQGALSWELRCAHSLARLWQARGRPDQAAQAARLLGGKLERFTEGFGTADQVAARALLLDLRAGQPPGSVAQDA